MTSTAPTLNNTSSANSSTSMDIEGNNNANTSPGNVSGNHPGNSNEKNAPPAGENANDKSGSFSNERNTNDGKTSPSNQREEKKDPNESSSSSSRLSQKLDDFMNETKSGDSGAGTEKMEEEMNATETLRVYQNRLQKLEEKNRELEEKSRKYQSEKSKMSEELSKIKKQEQEKEVDEMVGKFKDIYENLKKIPAVEKDDRERKELLKGKIERIVEKYKSMLEKNNGEVNKKELDEELSTLMLSSDIFSESVNRKNGEINKKWEMQNAAFREALGRAGNRRPKSYSSKYAPRGPSPEVGGNNQNPRVHTASANSNTNMNSNNRNSSPFSNIEERIFGKRRLPEDENGDSEEDDYIPEPHEILYSSNSEEEFFSRMTEAKNREMMKGNKRSKPSNGDTMFLGSTIHVASASSVKGFTESERDNTLRAFRPESSENVPPRLKKYGPHNVLPKDDPMLQKLRKLAKEERTEFTDWFISHPNNPNSETNVRELNEGEHQTHASFKKEVSLLREKANRYTANRHYPMYGY